MTCQIGLLGERVLLGAGSIEGYCPDMPAPSSDHALRARLGERVVTVLRRLGVTGVTVLDVGNVDGVGVTVVHRRRLVGDAVSVEHDHAGRHLSLISFEIRADVDGVGIAVAGSHVHAVDTRHVVGLDDDGTAAGKTRERVVLGEGVVLPVGQVDLIEWYALGPVRVERDHEVIRNHLTVDRNHRCGDVNDTGFAVENRGTLGGFPVGGVGGRDEHERASDDSGCCSRDGGDESPAAPRQFVVGH